MEDQIMDLSSQTEESMKADGAMMSVPEDSVTVETRDETEESERMVIIGTDEIQVHPDLSTTQTSEGDAGMSQEPVAMIIAPETSEMHAGPHDLTSPSAELELATAAHEAATPFPTTSEAQGQMAPLESGSLQVPGGSGAPGEISLCLVCSDKGSGYHYSVYSCEGCKGFFKRTVQKLLVYTCKENKNCVINKFTRNNCQYCRFQRCLAMGMKREAVREDRTPGGKHRNKRIRIEGHHGVAHLPDGSTTTTIVIPQEPVDEELLRKLVDSRPDTIPTIEGSGPPPNLSEMTIEDLMQYGYVELRYIIEWARKVPGFSELMIEDQMALLKASFMELNVLRLAYRSLDCNGGVRFAEGIVMTPEQSVNIGWGHDLINCTLEFITRLTDVSIDRTEFSLLNAVVLTYPDAAGVKDKESVMKLQCKILDCLRKYSLMSYPSEPRRYGRMLLRLPALRTISTKALERFLSMTLDGSVKMNALVLEIMT